MKKCMKENTVKLKGHQAVVRSGGFRRGSPDAFSLDEGH